MAVDNRDPESLGRLLLATRKAHPDRSLSEIAEQIDWGYLGHEWMHPAMHNGKSHLRIPPGAFK
jgi:hypothetical protein